MIKLSPLILLLSITSNCFSQTGLSGKWKSKIVTADTIALRSDLWQDDDFFIDNREFTDTSYYWYFNPQDSIRIERVERICRNTTDTLSGGIEHTHGLFVTDSTGEPKNIHSLKGSKKEARRLKKELGEGVTSGGRDKNNKEESLVMPETEDAPQQIRLSLHYPESGTWKAINKNAISVTDTISYNGVYKIVWVAPDRILLIRIRE